MSASNRITGVVVLVIGVIGLLDIALEWRTATGLVVACATGILMVLAYTGLVRPSVTLRREELLVRNHLRDHRIPWAKVTDVDVADTLRVHTQDRRIRVPAVQLVMRDLRKQRVPGRKLKTDNSISQADFVVGRIDSHREQYAESSTGEVRTTWARPELIAIALLAAVGLVAYLFR